MENLLELTREWPKNESGERRRWFGEFLEMRATPTGAGFNRY